MHDMKKHLLLGSAVCLSFFLAGCFSPVPVRLADKPILAEKQNPKSIKVCLIVKDERPEFIQNSNTVGINHQFIFYIPASQAFLAHMEHLDAITACNIKKRLEHDGYQVVSVFPSSTPEAINQKEISASDLDKKAVDQAWENRKAQEDKELEKLAEKNSKDGSASQKLDETTISPWGNDVKLNGADVVVELKIRKFWTIHGYFGSNSWASANFAVCSASDPKRTVLYGNKVVGFGYCMSLFTPLTPVADMGVSINASYWMMLYQIEKEIDSPEFAKAVGESLTKK